MNKNSTPTQPINEDPFGTIRKPNWDAWNTTHQTRLWYAVALACDLDPSNYQLFDNPSLSTLMKQPPKQFDDLLIMAKSSIGASGVLKLISKSAEGLEESEVKLSNFATWLKAIGHRPPASFLWQPEAITLSNMDWPWGRYETDLLRKFAAAADHFWKNYDPSEPSAAHTNKEVSDWLINHGVAVRTAEVMATMLRPDGLPTGPRKLFSAPTLR